MASNDDRSAEELLAYRQYIKRRDIMRKLYDTPVGRSTLSFLLSGLCFFAVDLESPEELALANAARKILYDLGIWRPENAERIIDALLAMPYIAEDEHE